MNKLIALTKNTFKETIRDRILLVIVFFAVILILSSLLMADISARQDEKIILDFGLAMINIFGVLITVFVGTSLIYREIEGKTISILLSKPIPRGIFILSKFFGLATVLFLTTVLMGGIFFCLVTPTAMLFLTIVFMFLSFVFLLAVVLFFSSFMRPLLAAFSSILVYVVGHITEDIKIIAEHNENMSILFKKIADGIYYIWPNFEILNLKNIAIYPDFIFTPLDSTLTIIISTTYIIILLYLASIIFAKKEF